MKIFIAGAKSQKELEPAVIQRMKNITNNGYDVLVGDCYGIDTSVQYFLNSINYNKVCVYASNGKARNNIGNWDVKNVFVPASIKGFDFYKQKDIAMANEADYGFMIWDGKSKGTLNNMINLLSQNKNVLLYYTKEHKMITLKSINDLNNLICSVNQSVKKTFYSLIPKLEIATVISSDDLKSEQLNIFT